MKTPRRRERRATTRPKAQPLHAIVRGVRMPFDVSPRHHLRDDPRHSIDREEIFVGLSGEARVEIDGADARVTPGDALVVPAGRSFSLSNPGSVPLVALALVPVGSRAMLPGGASFSPPWTL